MWTQLPKSDLRISLVQTNLFWAQPDANRSMFSEVLESLKGNTDLVLLPEMFTSGFAKQQDTNALAADYQVTAEWMLAKSLNVGAALCGSVLCGQDSGRPYNRMLIATPEGDLWHYDKVHLFRMAGEHERYETGNQRKIFTYRSWRILPAICYDLRFPVFLRNIGDYDLMVCSANWPASRRVPWRCLLQARAIENLSYVAGVNRIGTDGNGLDYSGDSMLIDYKGALLIDKPESNAFVETRVLSAEGLGKFREKFPAWQDADKFTLSGL